MKFIALGVLAFTSGILFTVLFNMLIGDTGIDILSKREGHVVSLNSDLILTSSGREITRLPTGTKLVFDSRYNTVGEFSIKVIISDLSLVTESTGDPRYFTSAADTSDL